MWLFRRFRKVEEEGFNGLYHGVNTGNTSFRFLSHPVINMAGFPCRCQEKRLVKVFRMV
jgi:hypothetical protein